MSAEHQSLATCPHSLQEVVEGYTDPHVRYDALREQARVIFDPSSRCWLVTGQASVRKILSDERFVSDPAVVSPPKRVVRKWFVTDAVQKQTLFMDGPKQDSVQKAILKELARKSDPLMAPLRARALELAERARERGEFDLVLDFSAPFAMEAIWRILGLPERTEEERADLERWSNTFADMTSGYLRMETNEIEALGEFFRQQVAARGGTPSDDLIGAFMRDGGLENDEEIVIQCMMAFAAGRITTQKLLGNGVPLLFGEWSEWRAKVQANPNATRRLTDELLRIITPTRYLARYATEEVVLGDENEPGPTLQRADKVILFLEAANRDPQAFPDPHCLVGDRAPNAHLAFGFGAHRCPGASIARVEIQIGLQALLETLTELRAHPTAPPTWDPNPNLGGYTSFPCVCS